MAGLGCSTPIAFISLKKIGFPGNKDGDHSQSLNFLQKGKAGSEPDGSLEVSHRRHREEGVGAGTYPGQHSTGCVSICPKASVPGSLEPSCWSGMLEFVGPTPCALVWGLAASWGSQGDRGATGGLQGVEAPWLGTLHICKPRAESVCHLPQRQIKSSPQTIDMVT